MVCLRCEHKHLQKIAGLSLELNGVDRQKSVSVSGVYCPNCNLLALEMNPAAAPIEAIRPINPE
jgi:hypothetical protein